MAVVKLKSAGSIEGFKLEGDLAAMLERPAMLVYAGEFLSMEGPVKVTPKHCRLMVANHNKRISSATAKLSAGAELPLKHYPPIQVDHSTSGWDTVGRLMGTLHLGEHELEDGTKVPAVFADKVRILGKENVERVHDGRWTHLSLGVDLDKGKISELTITPFSAAPDASLLSGGGQTEENTMVREKLKKHLMSRKNMSEKDAEEKLSGMDDEQMKHFAKECDDEEAKLKADEDKKKDDEAKLAAEAAKTARLTAGKTKLAQLSSGFKGVVEGARLAAKQGLILTRLSRLRAEAKVTPAEIKKMDITKLASSDETAIELVLKSYQDREPVIHVGQLGSTKAEDLARLGAEQQRRQGMSQLEAETRKNMSLLANVDKQKRLSAGEETGSGGFPEPAVPAASPLNDSADMAYFKKEADEICALMDQGSLDAAKNKVREWLTKVAAMATPGAAEYTESNASDTEAQLSALKESVVKLQAQYDELHGFAGSLIEA